MIKQCTMNSDPKVIAIDGPSASGKSTIAKELAKRLGYKHLDTGAIYRTIAVWVNKNGWTEEDKDSFIPKLSDVKYKTDLVKGKIVHMLNGEDITAEIRTPLISQLSSIIAVLPEVRRAATVIQRTIAKDQNIVVEGRDAGSVVFTRAFAKIYLTAQIEERAKRRLIELKKKFCNEPEKYTLEDTIEELRERDDRDRRRENSPMQRAIDAGTLDTTGKSVEEVLKKVLKIIKKRQPKRPNFIWRALVGERRATQCFIYKLSYLFGLIFLKLFYRIKFYGQENFPAEGECATIVAPNHVSFLDPPAIGISCPCVMNSLGMDYLFKAPFVRWFLPRLNVHPVSNDVTDASVIRKVVSILRKGGSVLIFPEGQRSSDGEILPLKRGVAVLAFLAKCSVTPTYIDGAYEAWPRNKKFPRFFRQRLTVVHGKPIFWKDYADQCSSNKEAQELMTNDLKNKIQELKDEFLKNKSSVGKGTK